MQFQSCPICGDEAEVASAENGWDHDPHGHFDSTNIPCTVCGVLPDEHGFVVGEPKPDHEYESGI